MHTEHSTAGMQSQYEMQKNQQVVYVVCNVKPMLPYGFVHF